MTARAVCVILLFTVLTTGSVAETCKDKFKQVEGHSACLPKSSKVKTSGISAEDRTRILDRHNTYRAKVSPAAANMLKMRWDDEIAQIAQRWAENCVYKHDGNSVRSIPGRFSVGQNIAAGYKDWTSVVDAWHAEVKDFTYGGSNNFKAVGHYTQMVWATSYRLGCGFADCSGTGRFYVCNYGPAGNGGGSKPYQTGNSICGQKYRKNNLCNCDIDCLNGGTWDLTDCSCGCLKNLKFYVGEQCELDCSKTNGTIPYYCGKGNFGEDGCKKYSNVPYECPLTCKVCPWAGIDYKEGNGNPPEGMAACITPPSHMLIVPIMLIGWIASTNRVSL